jgi:hypothetical protein
MKKAPAQTYRTYRDIPVDYLRNKLKLKSFQEKANLIKKYPDAAKFIGASALASTLLLNPMIVTHVSSPTLNNIVKDQMAEASTLSPQKIVVTDLSNIIPPHAESLTADQEKKISMLFSDVIGVKAVANLEGEHLNSSYGLIGAEQHLRRYPGDTIDNHGPLGPNDEGMAPGLGAWGYFASSKEKMTPKLVEDEKWYVVVQTLYLPDWSQRLAYLRDWYKYRKVLVVNTQNGSAVVGDIADSGPAAWTGKIFGGSPEVMNALGGPRYKVGAVVLFFVDDPDNKVPLGPVQYDKVMDIAGINLVEV